MLAQLSQWLLIAAIGQAAPEASLLKAAPADVDVAVRVRGLEATYDDFLAAVKAMDADWGRTIEGTLGNHVAEARQRHGEHAAKSPFLALLRMEEAEAGGPPPFAIVMPSDDYKKTLKELSGGKDVELKHQDGDYDAFDSPDGNGTWYAARATGIVAFGPAKGLIADIAKKPARTLDSVLTGSISHSFFGGDLGLYVNAAALTKRYSEQIDQARQTFMAALDQAGQQAGNAATMEMAKDIYGGLFDSLKYADALTLHLDFAAKGVHIASFLKVKADSDAAKSIPEVGPADLTRIGKLPEGGMVYAYLNVGAKAYDRLQGMSLKMISQALKPSPDLEKAAAAFHGLGRIESIAMVSMDKGMRSLKEIRSSDNKKFLEATIGLLRAMGGGQGQLYKDLKVQPDAQKHRGISFTHVSVTMDLEKLAAVAGNMPGQFDTMKAMFGDGAISYWYGEDGKRLLEVVTPKWEEARSMIDSYLQGTDGAGRGAGFQAVRSELPERASFLMLFSTQSLVQMFARQFSALTKNPNLKAPDNLPREAAYLGISLTPHLKEGYEFHLVVPAAVGPVINKGMIPVFQGLAPGANP